VHSQKMKTCIVTTTILQRRPKWQRCSAELYFTALLKFMNKLQPYRKASSYPIIAVLNFFATIYYSWNWIWIPLSSAVDPGHFYSAYYFLKLHLHHFSKIKSHKEVTKQ
jgi:hypothetical protein